MTVREPCGECQLMEGLLHALSQPLTALEVGLEISLRQDKDVAQLRLRVQSALKIAQSLHQKLSYFRESIRAEQVEQLMR